MNDKKKIWKWKPGFVNIFLPILSQIFEIQSQMNLMIKSQNFDILISDFQIFI